MSKKGYYVADPQNYIQQSVLKALEQEIEKEDAFLRVSFPRGQTGQKSGKISKILNKEKPKLFLKYIQASEAIFLDLLFNPDVEFDVDMVCKAVSSYKALDERGFRVVVVSSFNSWKETSPFEYFHQVHPQAFEVYLQKYNMPNPNFPTQDTPEEALAEEELKNTEEKEGAEVED